MQNKKTQNNHKSQQNMAFHSKFTGKIEYMEKEGPSKILQTCNQSQSPIKVQQTVTKMQSNKSAFQQSQKHTQTYNRSQTDDLNKVYRNHSMLIDSRYSQPRDVIHSYYNQNKYETANRNRIDIKDNRNHTDYGQHVDNNLQRIFDQLDHNKSQYISQLRKNQKSNTNFDSYYQNNVNSYSQIHSSKNSKINTQFSQFNGTINNKHNQLSTKSHNQVYAKMLFNN